MTIQVKYTNQKSPGTNQFGGGSVLPVQIEATSPLDRIKREKGVWWMPWQQEAMKDVILCDKPW